MTSTKEGYRILPQSICPGEGKEVPQMRKFKVARLIIAFFIVLAVILLVSGCDQAPILPSDRAREIRAELGYALAPTYLPDGFKFDEGMDGRTRYFGALEDDISFRATIMYSSEGLGGNQSLGLVYPAEYQEVDPLGGIRPEDAVSEFNVQGETAYFVRGSWSSDALWNYDTVMSLYFRVTVPTGETVGVTLTTAGVNPTEWISAKEMVKIAESVQVVE